ncbi:putative L-ascorbate oxidase [Mycena olivaceomarginata]|nr:putative L-ascorbate oxidase [Mycena olivaceomarginata]
MLPLALFTFLVTTNAYIWPSPQLDELDQMRFEQPLAAFVRPCKLFIFDGSNSGRSDTADWIRTAYHDMATHNVADGTGGMDGSIRFFDEMARPEDAGDGFQNTISVLAGQSNRYVSVADMLALGLIIAVENCGGPEIAFRGGRVDAVEPNVPGVPQPQEDLDSHIASFARQGFTQTEMIGLVACGCAHIRRPPNLSLHFDSTSVNFDNNIATEYISGTTQNPLVVGLNDTTNSDKRIFGSDGNATMGSFADSPELFASTCADLFAKMIDTVPRGVQLTEVITPAAREAHHRRFLNMAQDGDHTVRLLWDDHLGGMNNITLPAEGGFNNSGGRFTGAFYAFSPVSAPFLSIDAAAGITKMRFTVDDKLEDQGGLGFPLQDSVVLSASSCFDFAFNGSISGHLDIAVRNNITPTRVFMEAEISDDSGRPLVVEINVPRPSEPAAANATYSIWSVAVNSDHQYHFFSVGAEVDGVGTLLGPHLPFFFASCSNF